MTPPLSSLSDRDLVTTVARLAACERDATAELVVALAELDARRLYLGDGCASLFTYCTERLHLSESAAYHRIGAARAARRFPVILERLREGTLTLTTVCLLAPHLTDGNYAAVIDAARDLGKRAVEELVAQLQPRPDVASSIRKLPTTRATAGDRSAPGRVGGPPDRAPDNPPACAVKAHVDNRSSALPDSPLPEDADALPVPSRPAIIRPLSASRYQLQVTMSAETHSKLRRAQDLLRHTIPDGDPAAVLDRALTVLLQQLERTKCAAKAPSTHVKPRESTPPPRTRLATGNAPPAVGAQHAPDTPNAHSNRPSSRSGTSRGQPHGRSRAIPATVRRAVWARDGGQCSYVGTSGRCSERGFLEFHHRVPFAAGGEASAENVALLCRAHNAHAAWEDFPLDLESGAQPEARAELPTRGPSTASGASSV